MKQRVPLPEEEVNLFLSTIKSTRNIILFGAGLFVKPTIYSLKQYGITPICICDNSFEKQNTTIQGIPVVSPDKIKNDHPDGCVIITAAVSYIDEITTQLDELQFSKILNCAPLLASFEYNTNTFDSGINNLVYTIDNYFYEYFLKYYPDRLIIPSLDIVVTEKCSLRCRDCSNLMQYYEKPNDINFKIVSNALDILLDSVDHILEFRILGGEAFINKNMFLFVNYLRKYNNFTRIAVYSNGTITPKAKNLQCLIYDDTYVRISDYGIVSKNINKIKDIFNLNRIAFDIEKCELWQDCSKIFERKRTLKELINIYSHCCVNKFLTLFKSKLYICPFSANADNLKAIPSFPNDSLNLLGNINNKEIRIKIFNMLREKKYFSACKFCSGRILDNTPLEAAIQTKLPLSFTIYSS